MNKINIAQRGLWLDEEDYNKLCDIANKLNITPIEYILYCVKSFISVVEQRLARKDDIPYDFDRNN